MAVIRLEVEDFSLSDSFYQGEHLGLTIFKVEKYGLYGTRVGDLVIQSADSQDLVKQIERVLKSAGLFRQREQANSNSS